jgi:starch synthase
MLASPPVTDSLHIAYVTPEMAPFLKTGGLADVSAALPKALVRLGHRVTVVMPRYGTIAPGEPEAAVSVSLGGRPREAGLSVTRTEEGVEVVFVDHPPFFDRPHPYGADDDHLRFALLSSAALERFRSRGERPDVFHAHDWQAGLVPVYLKSVYWEDPTLGRLPSVFTIHNVAYQGQFGRDTVEEVGLPRHLGADFALGYHGGVSHLKGGAIFAEKVTTVSPTYAREIQGDEHGFGFQEVVRSRAADVVGILNGVDYEEWDPGADPYIARHYSSRDLAGKAVCRSDLLSTFGLPESGEVPLVGAISRLVWQKGFDIVAGAWWDLLQRPLRVAILGTGESSVEAGLADLVRRQPDRFAVRFAYDEDLAHRVMAGSDLFLMPSRSEPCGLTQMYALRYGTVPIVRATGGLADTVEQWDPATGQGTGFRFEHPDGTGLMWAIDQALAGLEDRAGWQRLMRNGMARDFSWERSAREYVELYRQAAQDTLEQ